MFNYRDLGFMIGIVMAIAELMKKKGINTNYIPIVNLIIGLLMGFFYVAPSDPREAILSGLIIGLSSSGVYTSGKHTKHLFNGKKEGMDFK